MVTSIFFSALRLALQLQEQHKSAVNLKVFLMSDAVTGGLAKQNPAEGYHLQQMLEILTVQGATIKLFKTCTNARGITELPLAEGGGNRHVSRVGRLDDGSR